MYSMTWFVYKRLNVCVYLFIFCLILYKHKRYCLCLYVKYDGVAQEFTVGNTRVFDVFQMLAVITYMYIVINFIYFTIFNFM